MWTSFVRDIDYDAKGQRQRIEYGNGVVTTYDYDALTFRLMRLRTVRDGASLQDSVLHLRPGRQHRPHRGRRAAGRLLPQSARRASQDFRYDAIYQLVEATGREHLGQLNSQAAPPTAPDAFDGFHVGLEHPGDGQAMGRYVERYVYDAVGNFAEMQHVGSDPSHPGWTRALRVRGTKSHSTHRSSAID